MSTDLDFVAYCAELMAAAGGVRSKRMFGGHGFYVDHFEHAPDLNGGDPRLRTA